MTPRDNDHKETRYLKKQVARLEAENAKLKSVLAIIVSVDSNTSHYDFYDDECCNFCGAYLRFSNHDGNCVVLKARKLIEVKS